MNQEFAYSFEDVMFLFIELIYSKLKRVIVIVRDHFTLTIPSYTPNFTNKYGRQSILVLPFKGYRHTS